MTNIHINPHAIDTELQVCIYNVLRYRKCPSKREHRERGGEKQSKAKDPFGGSGGSSVVKLWAHDQQVVGSNPMSSQRISFFSASFLC